MTPSKDVLEFRTEPPKAQPHLSFQTSTLGCRLKSQVSRPVWGLGSGDSLSSWPFLFRNYPFQPSSDLFSLTSPPKTPREGVNSAPQPFPGGFTLGTLPGQTPPLSQGTWHEDPWLSGWIS